MLETFDKVKDIGLQVNIYLFYLFNEYTQTRAKNSLFEMRRDGKVGWGGVGAVVHEYKHDIHV